MFQYEKTIEIDYNRCNISLKVYYFLFVSRQHAHKLGLYQQILFDGVNYKGKQ